MTYFLENINIETNRVYQNVVLKDQFTLNRQVITWQILSPKHCLKNW